MLKVFAGLETGLVALFLLVIFFAPQFNVSYASQDHPTYTTSCYWDKAILYDNNGRTICRTWSYAFACRNLMNNINTRSNGCENAPPFVRFGKDLGTYTENLTLNILWMTGAIGAGLVCAWALMLVRHWINSVFNLMVLFYGIASIFAAVYFINTRYAMDQLRHTGNNNSGQIVTFGEGFAAVLALPLVLLLHVQFIMDYKD